MAAQEFIAAAVVRYVQGCILLIVFVAITTEGEGGSSKGGAFEVCSRGG